MRKVFLHIGCGKTGSSALQVWLNKNAEALLRGGVYYPVFGSRIEDDYQITSGNGTHAVAAVQKKKAKQFFLDLLSESSENILLSSEAFQILDLEQVRELKVTFDELEVTPVIIAYARDLVDILNSGYSQLIKRHSFSKTFSEYIFSLNSPSQIQQFDVISLWSDVFENITILHYDSEKDAIDSSFLRALAISGSSIPPMAKNVVNRSLSPFELELLRYLNELHNDIVGCPNDAVSTKVSDALLKSFPQEETAVVFNKNIGNHLESVFGSYIDEFNDRYFDGKAVLSIFRPEGKKVIAEALGIDPRYKELLRVLLEVMASLDDVDAPSVVESRVPYDVSDSRFIEALYRHALHTEKKDVQKSLELMIAAKVLRPNGPVINAKIKEYECKLKGDLSRR